ncbi:hypothetical protein KIN20_003176 [Parelaphostrongylus tenuis]|uniref:UBX domain-containing protein n=1 Tax=Parelaphostrongylus tenuis TaxID=148309 RepID=A0AAD5MHW6_PARTN|nr:hypothetical protein KIN20_003176 [Parelaphostrongylus tenuis]
MEREFPVTLTLFSILECFSQVLGEDLVLCDGDSVPSCSYMNRQYTGHVELQRTTLLSIGISSGKRCLLRYQRMALTKEQIDEINARIASEIAEKEALLREYARKKAENDERTELEEARIASFEEESRMARKRNHSLDPGQKIGTMITDRRSQRSVDVPQSSTSTHPNSGDVRSLNSVPHEERTFAVDLRPSSQQEHSHHDAFMNTPITDSRNPLLRTTDVIDSLIEERSTNVVGPSTLTLTPCDRRAVIFLRQTPGDSTLRNEEVSDEFFEIDVEDVRTQLKQLREQINMTENRALVPKEYVKQKNREHKLSAYRHTVIRIPIGIGRIVQAQFQSAEPVSHLFDWIRGILRSSTAFSLKLALNQKLEESNTMNFVDADIAPKSTVFIKFNDPSVDFESLCVESLQECTHNEADSLCSEWLSHNTVFKPFTAVVPDGDHTISSSTNRTSVMPSHDSIRPSLKASTAPKWFKKK